MRNVVIMGEWRDAILQVLPSSGRPMARPDLEVRCTQNRRTALSDKFNSELDDLRRRRLVDSDGKSWWRIEPDFEENLLETGVEAFLGGLEALASLRLRSDNYVLQNTTMRGIAGGGKWSRPDFTMAAVRRFRYDPRRYLDVFTFELKNRRGSDVTAVHEALAHTRFSHYAYLVCPRSMLAPESTNLIRQSCADHSVGLITFDLSADDEDRPVLSNFRFESSPARRAPDPDDVDSQLDSRLSSANRDRLLLLASAS